MPGFWKRASCRGQLFTEVVRCGMQGFPKWCKRNLGRLCNGTNVQGDGRGRCYNEVVPDLFTHHRGDRHMPELSEFFENVQLPTMPDVARDLIATMRDDDIPFEKVRNAISRDPALTAKLIRLANSARFGLPRQVASLDDAITMVGLNEVRTLALAACMSGVFKDAEGVDATAFWKESMAIAGYAQWLARTLGSDVQQSWLAGFLVRLGELIIAQKAPEQIEAIEHLPHHAGGRWERERSLLGFSEAQVTA